MKVIARARVQITVEVDAGAPWGEDCSIGQLFKQAAETGRNSLLNAFSNACKTGSAANMRIIGEPKVVGIISETE